MPDSLSEQLQRDMAAGELLECFHGLRELDRDCYEALVDAEDPLTIDEVADAVGRERSTAYRAIQRLLEAGVVQRDQINYDQGGYYHVFYPTDPSAVADEMQRMLNDWYAQVGQLVHQFEDEYGSPDATPPSRER